VFPVKYELYLCVPYGSHKCDCSGKAQKQLYSKLQTRFLVRKDALIAKRRNCQTKEEDQDKIWSRIPKGGPIPRHTGRLTVGRKKNSNSNKQRLFPQTVLTGWSLYGRPNVFPVKYELYLCVPYGSHRKIGQRSQMGA
jgi:hypothetical protein